MEIDDESYCVLEINDVSSYSASRKLLSFMQILEVLHKKIASTGVVN